MKHLIVVLYITQDSLWQDPLQTLPERRMCITNKYVLLWIACSDGIFRIFWRGFLISQERSVALVVGIKIGVEEQNEM